MRPLVKNLGVFWGSITPNIAPLPLRMGVIGFFLVWAFYKSRRVGESLSNHISAYIIWPIRFLSFFFNFILLQR
ncbi:hypothetical protein Hanom_Chr10g00964851 [Helianthus anomalus]